jgi:hypothetical protein
MEGGMKLHFRPDLILVSQRSSRPSCEHSRLPALGLAYGMPAIFLPQGSRLQGNLKGVFEAAGIPKAICNTGGIEKCFLQFKSSHS